MAPLARALGDALQGRPARIRFRTSDGASHELAATRLCEPFGYSGVEEPALGALAARLPAGGRVLDVGCGVGRHARWLEARGIEVDAIDLSREMVAVARAQGVPARVASAFALPPDERYDAALLLGNSLGLCGSRVRLRDLLRSLADRTPLVVADSVDLGEEGAEVRARIEYGGQVGAWFDWLHVTREELELAARELGLHLEWIAQAPGGAYAALLCSGPSARPIRTTPPHR
jgi:SAM-dependent methyltransferase